MAEDTEDLPEGYEPPEPTHPGYAYRTPEELAAEQLSEPVQEGGWVPSEPPDPDD